MNNRFAGRPKTSFILNLNHVDNTIEELSDVIDLNKNRHWMEAKSKLKVFAQKLNDLVTESKQKEVQTEKQCETVIELSEELCSGDKIFVCSTIWDTFDERNRLAVIYKFYNLLSFNEQCTFFKMLGQKFNKLILEDSQKLHERVKSMTLVDLSNVTKVNRYLESDQRLQSFFNEMTKKTGCYRGDKYVHDNTNEKYNVIENIYKARNFNFVSDVGISESVISYFASDKSKHNSQVISKQGGKGTRGTLETFIQRSMNSLKFDANAVDRKTIQLTFDNIQTMIKSHRIFDSQKGNVLAVIVTSD